MKKSKVILAAALVGILFQAGCYTKLYVNFGNGTGQKIEVKDLQTGQKVQIPPGKFRKIGHGQADIIVTTPDKTHYVFTGIKVADQAMDPKYYGPKRGVFGAFSFDLNILLQTNMEIYVLFPGKLKVDEQVEQPKGYPKIAADLQEEQATH